MEHGIREEGHFFLPQTPFPERRIPDGHLGAENAQGRGGGLERQRRQNETADRPEIAGYPLGSPRATLFPCLVSRNMAAWSCPRMRRGRGRSCPPPSVLPPSC